MKVFIHVNNAAGHVFACVGLAQSIVARGHEVTFLMNELFADQVRQYNLEVIGLKPLPSLEKEMVAKSDDAGSKEHPFKIFGKKLIESGMLSNKTPLEKLSHFSPDDKLFNEVLKECIHIDPQIAEAIETHKPDVIIVDNFLIEPAIVRSGVPFVSLFSGNPLIMYYSKKLPSFASGLAIDASEEEKAVNWKALEATFVAMISEKNRQMWEEVTGGLPPADLSGLVGIGQSKYLNLYGYPEELDYNNIVERPANLIGVDAFCRETPGKFELPEEFKAKIQAGDKLIYLSMGSMGAANTDMVNRLLELVANSRHKFIVSMGPLHEDIKLPDNAWGGAFLPQTQLLPLVALVITHGGNNSVTETFIAGKPMIVMPLFGDQWDNAQRIHETGFGIRMNPFECTKEELNGAIEKLLNDQELAKRLQAASKRIANSNSKEKAVIEIEGLVAKHKK